MITWINLWENLLQHTVRYVIMVSYQSFSALLLSDLILMIFSPQDLLTASPRLATAKPVWPVWPEDRGTTQSPPPSTLWDGGQPRSRQSSIWWPPNSQGKIFYFSSSLVHLLMLSVINLLKSEAVKTMTQILTNLVVVTNSCLLQNINLVFLPCWG